MQKDERAGEGLSRREAMGLVGAAGLGVASVLSERGLSAQAAQAPAAPAPNPNTPVKPFEPSTSAPPIRSWPTELKQLAPNVYAYIQEGGPGKPNQSNAGVIVGPDGMMAIDALTAPLLTQAFMAAAKKASGGKPFTHVVDTHHHGDHIAGNQFFMPCEIMAHEYCRDEVQKQANAIKPGTLFAKQEGRALGTEVRKIAVPNVAFYGDRMITYVGNIRVEWLFHIAHTWGDIVGYLPNEKVLFAGDVLFNDITPWAQNAHVSKWIEFCDQLDKLDIEYVVPGHGPVGPKKDLAAMADYYRTLMPAVKKRYDKGMTPGAAAAEISEDGTLKRWQNWIVSEQIVRNVVRIYAEWNSTLVPDVMDTANNNAIQEYNMIKRRSSASGR